MFAITRSRVLILAIAGLSVVAAPAMASFTGSTETKPYIAAPGNDTGPLPGGLINDCTGNNPSVGGTCFNVPDGATFVTVTIADDNMANTSAGLQFTDNAVPLANNIGSTIGDCNGVVKAVPVPSGAKLLFVFVGADNWALTCKRKGGQGSTGTATAVWS